MILLLMAKPGLVDRQILLGPGCIPVPEALLLAHARGRVLFITGAGTSAAASLPDFRRLVLDTYSIRDTATHNILLKIPQSGSLSGISFTSLNHKQQAEVLQFCRSNYDVVLGMLERRIDGSGTSANTVRTRITDVIRQASKAPADIHHALIKLSDRGGAHSIATTNYDLLLEQAARRQRRTVQSYSLGAIPRPSLSSSFSGVMHIHGALDPLPGRTSEIIATDEDFGEFYMRRRVVPDFIYDAARLYNIALIGYSANDPPMRYLLSAVAADGSRFEDFKERFTFFGQENPDAVALEDWRGRGITPIPYDSANHHVALLNTLNRWSELSAINGKGAEIEKAVRRLCRRPRASTSDAERDLFDHLFRRASQNERIRLAKVASEAGAEPSWLDAILDIASEPAWSGS